jgi:hypothetical protein
MGQIIGLAVRIRGAKETGVGLQAKVGHLTGGTHLSHRADQKMN